MSNEQYIDMNLNWTQKANDQHDYDYVPFSRKHSKLKMILSPQLYGRKVWLPILISYWTRKQKVLDQTISSIGSENGYPGKNELIILLIRELLIRKEKNRTCLWQLGFQLLEIENSEDQHSTRFWSIWLNSAIPSECDDLSAWGCNWSLNTADAFEEDVARLRPQSIALSTTTKRSWQL